MSEENVEIVRSAYDAWNRGDLDSVFAHLDADVEWEENPDVYPGVDRNPARGRGRVADTTEATDEREAA